MKWSTITMKVVNLILDEDNIRLENSIKSQDALIHDLFINQDALEIVESIGRNGLFPHELPIVVKEKGKYIVLEGNRRVAALKAIINPSLVPNMQNKINHIKKSNKDLPITEIEVKVAPSRNAATYLIGSIHTENTRRRWSPLRQAYFYSAQIESGSKKFEELVKEYPGIDIAKFIKMWQMHTLARSIKYDSDDVARVIANQQKFPISTLERFYENDAFKEKFHFDFDSKGNIRIGVQEKSFKEALKTVMTDIANGVVDSRNSNTIDDIKKHLERWQPPKGNAAVKPTTVIKPKPTVIPPVQLSSRGIAPRDMVCTLKYPALNRVLLELQSIDYRKYPNATHDLMRSFLECSLKAYFDYKKIVVTHKGPFTFLKDLLIEAEKHFLTAKRNLVQPIKIIRGSDSYLYSEDFLNAINHNHSVFATGDGVKNAWDQMEPVLRFILDPK